MAYLLKNHGRPVIQIRLPSGKRCSIRLGKVDLRTAQGVKLHIDRLEEAKGTGMPVLGDTAIWLVRISDELHDRISRAHLCPPREAGQFGAQLGPMLDAYLKRRSVDLKQGSMLALTTTRNQLIEFFGADKHLASFNSADADDWRRWLKARLAKATISKMTMVARQYFADAVRRELTTKNPLAGIKPGSQKNPARQRFISREIIDRVIAVMPTPQWKLIIGFARYGGLRIPSEIARMEWSDIDWERKRILIRSPKTEHHEGHETRLLPLFPELVTLLADVKKCADPEEKLLFPKIRLSSMNLRKTLCDMLKRLKIEPWPKIFQNLRSSRQTELSETFPGHVVCKWLGNSERIAADHYLQTTSDHFMRAAEMPTGVAKPTVEPQVEQKPLVRPSASYVAYGRGGAGKSAVLRSIEIPMMDSPPQVFLSRLNLA